MNMMESGHTLLLSQIEQRTARVGVIGLGYVGLPLAVTTAEKGFPVTGFDVDASKMVMLNAGQSYIGAVGSDRLGKVIAAGTFDWTTDFAGLAACDVIIICVPTPLTRHREPDLSFIEDTARSIAANLKPSTLVVLESTTFPGTTDEVLAPILETSGLKAGVDFFVGFSPEREDPGNANFHTATIPKVVAGDGKAGGELVAAFYGAVVDRIVPVSSARTAEAVKITENIFRAVNIALVNELKVIYDAMGIDVWEVIDAAATKPFGFMPFYPGPGLGGHCIPIDPFYLTWKAREYGVTTRFIELAGEINTDMPHYVMSRLRRMLDQRLRKGLNGTRILLVGVSYKKNISDMRESPSMLLMEMLAAEGARVDYLDPHVPVIPATRDHPTLTGRKAITPEAVAAQGFDAVLIATDHDAIDYAALIALGIPVLDTRNAITRRGLAMDLVEKA
jgi:UDP-N-acetyl-D-glucosamine dehydrogenase